MSHSLYDEYIAEGFSKKDAVFAAKNDIIKRKIVKAESLAKKEKAIKVNRWFL